MEETIKPLPPLGIVGATQEGIDASREPLNEEERDTYERVTEEWQTADKIGSERVLDTLTEKGWVAYTWHGEKDAWVYQRTHNLD